MVLMRDNAFDAHMMQNKFAGCYVDHASLTFICKQQ